MLSPEFSAGENKVIATPEPIQAVVVPKANVAAKVARMNSRAQKKTSPILLRKATSFTKPTEELIHSEFENI